MSSKRRRSLAAGARFLTQSKAEARKQREFTAMVKAMNCGMPEEKFNLLKSVCQAYESANGEVNYRDMIAGLLKKSIIPKESQRKLLRFAIEADIDKSGILFFDNILDCILLIRHDRGILQSLFQAQMSIKDVYNIPVTDDEHVDRKQALQAAMDLASRANEVVFEEEDYEGAAELYERAYELYPEWEALKKNRVAAKKKYYQKEGLRKLVRQVPIQKMMTMMRNCAAFLNRRTLKLLLKNLHLCETQPNLYVDLMDYNGSGFVDRTELLASLTVICKATRKERLETSFEMWDEGHLDKTMEVSNLGYVTKDKVKPFLSMFCSCLARSLAALVLESGYGKARTRSQLVALGFSFLRNETKPADIVEAYVNHVTVPVIAQVTNIYDSFFASVIDPNAVTFAEFVDWIVDWEPMVEYFNTLDLAFEEEVERVPPRRLAMFRDVKKQKPVDLLGTGKEGEENKAETFELRDPLRIEVPVKDEYAELEQERAQKLQKDEHQRRGFGNSVYMLPEKYVGECVDIVNGVREYKGEFPQREYKDERQLAVERIMRTQAELIRQQASAKGNIPSKSDKEETETKKQLTMEEIFSLLDTKMVSRMKKDFIANNYSLEIQNFVKVVRKRMVEADINQFDITEHEIGKGICEMFKQIDVDGEGEVDWDDFTMFIVQHAQKNSSNNDVELNNDRHSGPLQQYSESHNLVDPYKPGNPIDKIKVLSMKDMIGVVRRGTNELSLYDADTLEFSHSLRDHRGVVMDFIEMPDRNMLATASRDNFIYLWDCNKDPWKLQRRLFTSSIQTCMGYFPGLQDRIYSGSIDNNIYQWNTNRMYMMDTFYGHSDVVTSLLPVGVLGVLISGSLDKKILVWDITSGAIRQELSGHRLGVTSMSYTDDSKLLFSSGAESEISVWNPLADKRICTMSGHSSSVVEVHAVENSPMVVSADVDGIVKLWDVRTFKEAQTINQADGEPISGLQTFTFCEKRSRIYAASKKITVFEHHVEGNAHLTDDFDIVGAEYNDESMTLVTVSSKFVRIWDAQTGRLMRVYSNLIPGDITSFCLDPLKRKFIIGDHIGNIKVFKYETGLQMKVCESHNKEVTSLAALKGTKFFMSASWDSNIHVYKDSIGDSMKTLYTLEGHSKDVTCMSVSDEYKIIVTGGGDKTARVWNIKYNKLVGYFADHEHELTSVRFIGDHPLIISCDNAGTMCLWMTKPALFTDQCFLKLTNKHTEVYHYSELDMMDGWRKFVPKEPKVVNSAIMDMTYDSINNVLYTGDDRGNITLWDMTQALVKLRLIPDPSLDREKGLEQMEHNKHERPVLDSGDVKMIKRWEAHTAVVSIHVVVTEEKIQVVTAGNDHLVKVWSNTGQLLGTLRQRVNQDWNMEVDVERRKQQRDKQMDDLMPMMREAKMESRMEKYFRGEMTISRISKSRSRPRSTSKEDAIDSRMENLSICDTTVGQSTTGTRTPDVSHHSRHGSVVTEAASTTQTSPRLTPQGSAFSLQKVASQMNASLPKKKQEVPRAGSANPDNSSESPSTLPSAVSSKPPSHMTAVSSAAVEQEKVTMSVRPSSGVQRETRDIRSPVIELYTKNSKSPIPFASSPNKVDSEDSESDVNIGDGITKSYDIGGVLAKRKTANDNLMEKPGDLYLWKVSSMKTPRWRVPLTEQVLDKKPRKLTSEQEQSVETKHNFSESQKVAAKKLAQALKSEPAGAPTAKHDATEAAWFEDLGSKYQAVEYTPSWRRPSPTPSGLRKTPVVVLPTNMRRKLEYMGKVPPPLPSDDDSRDIPSRASMGSPTKTHIVSSMSTRSVGSRKGDDHPRSKTAMAMLRGSGNGKKKRSSMESMSMASVGRQSNMSQASLHGAGAVGARPDIE